MNDISLNPHTIALLQNGGFSKLAAAMYGVRDMGDIRDIAYTIGTKLAFRKLERDYILKGLANLP